MSGISRGLAIRVMLVIVVIVLALTLFFGPLSDVISQLDGDQVSVWVNSAGVWGPILIIGLMTIAIVATPIPSVPIALAAGAAYGHTLGTAYIVIGAELGALIAFLLARFLGRDALSRWIGDRFEAGLLGSQNALTATVFGSRLLPFVSFDIVSYAAGLSALHFWRFALATLAGIIPASFILAHFGTQAVDGKPGVIAWVAAGLGALTLIPLVVAGVKDWRRQGAERSC